MWIVLYVKQQKANDCSYIPNIKTRVIPCLEGVDRNTLIIETLGISGHGQKGSFRPI